jgi:hypothetical protein
MPHYKDLNNGVHFLDDASFAHYLPEGSVEITDAEAESLLPTPTELTYKDLRAAEYPSYADQFDLLYHGGLDAWKDAIQTVKDKYPKE